MVRFQAIIGILALSLSLGTATVFAQNGKLSGTDKEFMEKAAMGGKMEVTLGEMAGQKAESPEVKAFGRRMVHDHSQANDQLKAIAQKHNVALPEELDQKHQKAVDKLSGLNGAAFDRAYMKNMVEDHKKDIETFKKEARHGENPEVKQFASDTLKTLEEHLELAKTVHQQVSGEK